MLPAAAACLPPDLKIRPLFDQSLFVKSSIDGVVREALIAACLTAAMILLFLGDWRSTCIIALSIPLSILSSILALYALGQTLNIMTLGGLALAVGILVDDATVTIENIERHLHLGTDFHQAIFEGAAEIAVPAFVSTLCICIVFVPMFFLTAVARYLFTPLAEAVVFAMLASYLLSRTLVPTLVMLMMDRAAARHRAAPGLLQRIYRRFDAAFEQLRTAYLLALSRLLTRRGRFIAMFAAFCALSCALFPLLGRDFFPAVDAGLIRLHARLPTGTRIEETARAADLIEASIRRVIPPGDLGTVLDNLGLPISGINLSYSTSGTIGTMDAEILVSMALGVGEGAEQNAPLGRRRDRGTAAGDRLDLVPGARAVRRHPPSRGRPRRSGTGPIGRGQRMTERRHASLGMQAALSSGSGVFAGRSRVLRIGRRLVIGALLVLAAAAILVFVARGLRARDLGTATREQARQPRVGAGQRATAGGTRILQAHRGPVRRHGDPALDRRRRPRRCRRRCDRGADVPGLVAGAGQRFPAGTGQHVAVSRRGSARGGARHRRACQPASRTDRPRPGRYGRSSRRGRRSRYAGA
jgi:hypothetical protein